MIEIEKIIDALGWYPDQVNGVRKKYNEMVKQIKQDHEDAKHYNTKCAYCGKSFVECVNNHVHYCKRELSDEYFIYEQKAKKDRQIVSKLKEVDWSKIYHFTGTKTGDREDQHNEEVNKLQEILEEKE